ncbi:Cytidine and deoxycytidylate deaminase zinc-binding region [compost metagenome]
MGSCLRGTVVAIGTPDYQSYFTGENHNESDCTGEKGNCGCIHAEAVLLKKCPNPIYVIVSMSPCLSCAKLLLNAGVKRVDYITEYRLLDGVALLRENGIETRCLRSEVIEHNTDKDLEGPKQH